MIVWSKAAITTYAVAVAGYPAQGRRFLRFLCEVGENFVLKDWGNYLKEVSIERLNLKIAQSIHY